VCSNIQLVSQHLGSVGYDSVCNEVCYCVELRLAKCVQLITCHEHSSPVVPGVPKPKRRRRRASTSNIVLARVKYKYDPRQNAACNVAAMAKGCLTLHRHVEVSSKTRQSHRRLVVRRRSRRSRRITIQQQRPCPARHARSAHGRLWQLYVCSQRVHCQRSACVGSGAEMLVRHTLDKCLQTQPGQNSMAPPQFAQ